MHLGADAWHQECIMVQGAAGAQRLGCTKVQVHSCCVAPRCKVRKVHGLDFLGLAAAKDVRRLEVDRLRLVLLSALCAAESPELSCPKPAGAARKYVDERGPSGAFAPRRGTA